MAVADDFATFDDDGGRRHGGVFGVVFDPRTWGSLLYMLLAMPLGIAYFTFVSVGIPLSLGLMILIIGIVVALAFIALVRFFSTVEGYILTGLLGADIPSAMGSADDLGEDGDTVGSENKLWAWIKNSFSDWRTWSSMLYMGLMLPLGIAYFTMAVTGLSVSLSFMLAPVMSVISEDSVHFHVADVDPAWLIQVGDFAEGPVRLVVITVLGFVAFYLMLHIARLVGRFHAKLGEALLVRR